MAFTFFRDLDSNDGSTTTVIELSPDLTDWSTIPPYAVPDTDTGGIINPGVTVLAGQPPGFDTVTLTLPLMSDPGKFFRLKVTVGE